jgi:hypothetical protein
MSTPAIRAALERWRDQAQTDLLCPANPAETDWGAVVVAIAATRAALAPPEGDGPSLAEVDELCAEFGFHLDDDQGEGLEILQEMIGAALARWGRPTAPPAPEPGEGRWSEGVCGDGAAILFDGVMIPIEEVVQALNRTPPAPPAPPAPEAGEVGEFELTPREVEAQEAFTQLRDEVLNLSDGVEVNEVLGIIDNHTPGWV